MSNNSIRRASLVIANAAVLFFCTASFAAQQPTPVPPTAPSLATATQTPPAATPPKSAPSSDVRRVFRRSTYLCEGDAKLIVSSSGPSARVIFKDHIYIMKPVADSSGTKYSNGSVVWSVKDDEGLLEDDSKPEKVQVLAKGCHLQQDPPPAKP